MKRFYKLLLCLFILFGTLVINTSKTFAAGVSLSASSTSITIGQTITFTLSVTDCYALINSASSSNGSVSGGSGDIDALGETKYVTYKVTPTSVGSGSFTVSGVYSAYTGSSEDQTFTKKIPFNVKAKSSSSGSQNSNSNSSSNASSTSNSNNKQTVENSNETVEKEDTRSKENSLASLSVSEGTLSPSFKSSTTKYTVDLAGDKTKITISAKAKDSKAKVSGTGEKSLKVGENTFTVKCTAENGDVKSYTIIVNVDETPLVYTELNGKKLGVVRNLEDVNVPNKSFNETKVTLDEQEIPAWTSEQMNKTIVYLMDENNEKNFYLFEDGKVTSKFVPISLNGINMFIVDIPENNQEIKGMKYTTLSIEKQDIPGWLFENDKLENYELIYVMLENGNMGYYLHEKTENTLMLYSDEFIKQTEEIETLTEDNASNTLMRNIFIGTTIVFAVSTAAVGYLYLSFKKKSISAIKEYYDKKNQG